MPSGFVTFTVAAPPIPGGVIAVIVVLLTTTILLAVDTPKERVAPGKKFVPVICTAVPPFEDPVAGLIDVIDAPGLGDVSPVVKLQTGPLELRFAMVLETIFHR